MCRLEVNLSKILLWQFIVDSKTLNFLVVNNIRIEITTTYRGYFYLFIYYNPTLCKYGVFNGNMSRMCFGIVEKECIFNYISKFMEYVVTIHMPHVVLYLIYKYNCDLWWLLDAMPPHSSCTTSYVGSQNVKLPPLSLHFGLMSFHICYVCNIQGLNAHSTNFGRYYMCLLNVILPTAYTSLE